MSSVLHTPLCSLLGIELPIVQAPIGSATCPELAAAVSNAGGLGMLAMSWRTPPVIREMIRRTRALTQRPFGVNLVLQWDQRERLDVCLEEGVRVLSFFWGDPAPYAERARAAGAKVLHTVGSAAEARRAKAAGAEVVVAQGFEAGGHVCGTVTTMALVPRVVDAVAPAPVVAAGGIADGRGLAAALVLGAAGAWIGTRFLASSESAAHDLYKRRILDASETDTAYSTLFDGGWPNAPHRTLRNSTVAQWEAAGQPQGPSRPGEGEVVGKLPDGRPVQRYSDTIPLAGMTGDLEAMALYAGQGAGMVQRIQPAGEIVRQLASEAGQALQKG